MTNFSQFPGTSLFTSNGTAGEGFLGFYRTGMGTASALTIEEIWNSQPDTGYLIFLQPAPTDLSKLSSAIEAYRSTVGNKLPDVGHTSIAWITYEANEVKNVLPIILQYESSGDTVIVAEDTVISLPPYGIPFSIADRVVLQRSADKVEDSLLFEYAAIPGAPAPVPGFQRALPLTGQSGGSLLFQASIGDCSDQPATGWNVGIKYFYPGQDRIKVLSYPIFELQPGDQLLFDVKMDPLLPTDASRTSLRFKSMFQIKSDPVTGSFYLALPERPSWLPTTFRTIYGHPIYLIPVTDTSSQAASLVMQPLPVNEAVHPLHYLTLSGDFWLAVKDEAAKPLLMGGLMGTEGISFTTAVDSLMGDKISFYPDSPAFASTFPFKREQIDTFQINSEGDDLLGMKYRTAWAGIQKGDQQDAPQYYAQPESSALFLPTVHGSEPSEGELNLMPFFPAPAASFGPGNTSKFPIVPYSGASADSEVLRDFELNILNPSRREHMGSNTLYSAGSSFKDTTVTTPQGFLVTIDSQGWTSVLLARNSVRNKVLEFTGDPLISNNVREALQSNQLFMVVTLNSSLGAFKNEIDIDGWPFTINPKDVNGELSNVLIIKFCDGNLRDLAAESRNWTKGSTFNKNPGEVSGWLVNYLNDAIDQASKNNQYTDFAELVVSDAWNGILALKVDIGLDNFPDDLKGLLGGIDLDSFNGHHFGIEANNVKTENGKLVISKSSLFGLINYYDPAYALSKGISAGQVVAPKSPVNPGAEGYDFKVLYLQVAFKNSTIIDFASLVQLSVTKWFGESAFSDCTIQFIGSREEHNGQSTYSFTTQKDKNYQFFMDSKVLNYIQIVKARFNTNIDLLKLTDTSEEVSAIRSAFSFWGYLNFNQLPEFDPLSFGDPKPTVRSINSGLYFYNLSVVMKLKLIKTLGTAPTFRVTDRTFAFSEENTSFDTSLSQVHANSLYPNFPLGVTGIVNSNSGSLQELGYLPIELPDTADFEPAGKDWYGLEYQLNLGSMGALASLAGFSAKMLIAWSPAKSKPALTIAIRLPGTEGVSGFAFENVLQLSIGSMAMEVNHYNDNKTVYALRLRGIALSLLGLNFPQGATTDLVLYGNPESPKQIGWYGQYLQKS